MKGKIHQDAIIASDFNTLLLLISRSLKSDKHQQKKTLLLKCVIK